VRRAILLYTLLLFSFLNANIVIKDIKSTKVKEDSNITSSIKDLNSSLNNFKIDSLRDALLISLEVKNSSDKKDSTILFFNSPTIEELKVFKKENNSTKLIEDLSFNSRKFDTIYPYINITLEANSTKKYLIYANSKYIFTNFKIATKSKEEFFKDTTYTILIYSIILGVVVVIFSIYFMVYLFSDKRVYLYFSIFLLMSILLYLYFSGIEQIFVSNRYMMLEKSLIGIKFNIASIMLSLFTLSIFNIKKDSKIYKIYRAIIYFSIFEIFILSFINITYIILPILMILPIVNLIVGLIYFSKGKTYAVVYLFANLILILGLNANIAKVLFDFNLVNRYKVELFLSGYILFALVPFYRYYLYKKDEERVFQNILDKKLILDNKIKDLNKKIDDLKNLKAILHKGMNDIIKNNLQMVLSMLNMKNREYIFGLSDEIAKLNRKFTIFIKIYSLILASKNEKIDLKEYIPKVIDFIQNEYKDFSKSVIINLDISANVEQNEALDIAITVANMLIGTYEDNTQDSKIEIKINKVKGEYKLTIKDLYAKNGILDRVKGAFN
jgi:hypothetical protein